jgi:hypothetical protein
MAKPHPQVTYSNAINTQSIARCYATPAEAFQAAVTERPYNNTSISFHWCTQPHDDGEDGTAAYAEVKALATGLHMRRFFNQLGPVVNDKDSGITYQLWTDGHAIGYKITHPGGRVAYLYLNAGGGSDDGAPTVFAYQGYAGDLGEDSPICHFDVREAK